MMLFKEIVILRGVVLVFDVTMTSPTFSQNDLLSSLYWNNYSTINPANSGLEYKHFYSVQARDQWTDVERNPQTKWVVGDIKTKFLHGGLGLNYMNYQLGNTKSQKLALNYSFQIQIKEHHESHCHGRLLDWGFFSHY